MVRSDYNISQYIHMSDKGWRLSDFGSAFFNLNTENSTIPLNPRPKRPPYILFLCCMNPVLYVCCINGFYACCIFCVVIFVLCEIVFFSFPPIFWNWKQNRSCLIQASSWSVLSWNQIRRTWSLLACPAGFLERFLLQIIFF